MRLPLGQGHLPTRCLHPVPPGVPCLYGAMFHIRTWYHSVMRPSRAAIRTYAYVHPCRFLRSHGASPCSHEVSHTYVVFRPPGSAYMSGLGDEPPNHAHVYRRGRFRHAHASMSGLPSSGSGHHPGTTGRGRRIMRPPLLCAQAACAAASSSARMMACSSVTVMVTKPEAFGFAVRLRAFGLGAALASFPPLLSRRSAAT